MTNTNTRQGWEFVGVELLFQRLTLVFEKPTRRGSLLRTRVTVRDEDLDAIRVAIEMQSKLVAIGRLTAIKTGA